jgi:hypothetical protein
MMRLFAVTVVAFPVSLFSGVLAAQNRPAPKSVVIFLDDFHIDFQNTPKLRTGIQTSDGAIVGSGTSRRDSFGWPFLRLHSPDE